MDMRSRGEPRISAHTGIRHSSSKTHKISPFLRKIPKLYFSFVLNFCSNLGFLTAMAVISGISSGTLTISRPLVTLRRSRAAVSYISSHQLFRHRPLTSRRLLFRNIDRVQATILQDDEEKLVVDESFKAKTFTGKEPLEEPNMNSSSSSAFESWIIKLEQGVNVFLTDSVIKILDTLYRDRTYARFFVLETIARVPYFAFMSVLHIYETFGWWRRADHLNVHFAESWNEMHHLLIMEV